MREQVLRDPRGRAESHPEQEAWSEADVGSVEHVASGRLLGVGGCGVQQEGRGPCNPGALVEAGT